MEEVAAGGYVLNWIHWFLLPLITLI